MAEGGAHFRRLHNLKHAITKKNQSLSFRPELAHNKHYEQQALRARPFERARLGISSHSQNKAPRNAGLTAQTLT